MAYGYFPTQPTSTRPDIPTVISIGHVTRVLAEIDLAKNKAFKGGTRTPSKYLPMLLGMEVELLEWANTYGQRSDSIEFQANYVWALIGGYAGAALRALGNGNGVVINPTTGTPLNIQRYREDFVVDGVPTANYPITAGDISYTVPLSGFVIADFLYNGVAATEGITDSVSLTRIVYQPDYVRFELDSPLQAGDIITVWGLRSSNVVSPTSSGSSAAFPIPYRKGAYLTNDETNVLWDSPVAHYDSTNFESDGITVIDSTLSYHSYILYWNTPTATELVEGTDYEPILSGGFTILVPGFDANTQPSSFTAMKKQSTT